MSEGTVRSPVWLWVTGSASGVGLSTELLLETLASGWAPNPLVALGATVCTVALWAAAYPSMARAFLAGRAFQFHAVGLLADRVLDEDERILSHISFTLEVEPQRVDRLVARWEASVGGAFARIWVDAYRASLRGQSSVALEALARGERDLEGLDRVEVRLERLFARVRTEGVAAGVEDMLEEVESIRAELVSSDAVAGGGARAAFLGVYYRLVLRLLITGPLDLDARERVLAEAEGELRSVRSLRALRLAEIVGIERIALLGAIGKWNAQRGRLVRARRRLRLPSLVRELDTLHQSIAIRSVPEARSA